MSFLGLRTEFPILVCDLSTDAIIGTNTLKSILPHTLDIKNGLLYTEGGVSLQLHRRDAALSGRVFTVGHCSIPPHSEAVLHCTTRSGLLEGLTSGGRPDIGRSIRMEGPCAGVQLRSRNSHGETIFGDWHDGPGVSDSTYYEQTTSSVVRPCDLAGTFAVATQAHIRRSGQCTEEPTSQYIVGACPPRRLNRRRSALMRCCPVDKSSRARVRGQHRWYW